MAVENKYVSSQVASGKLEESIHISGNQEQTIVAVASVATADEDGSIYRIAKNLNPDLIPIKLTVSNTAITGGTDYDLGLYATLAGGVGAAIDADAFADGINVSGARGVGAPLNVLSELAADLTYMKRLYEIAGDTIKTKKPGYDLVLTANTVGSADGTVLVRGVFAQG